ncbi:hypothetical protein RRV45_09500 [Bacillus sp. DTU_2020_1000418_1_SI_GHA_SEK_038]|uniref:hypothetical protein n=1 Tax=Bacillus sp. DTU_2020_1000418_1_SI_GHA_SEK_038 TaxID=3077585 RepID=UPI0028E492F1|nr:hypothetical protein [Bacillus sp. DTU_2020_1000418_1_SI_GHA_SEK_038]WNS77201.1 hypothetical protein RRV45_09500 [Bacillus sp. DTU_2020_1000418_1_SI_GHA_SEK_038]
MSLKSIEMQIALPRTMEVGKIQEQLQQRGQNINDFATERTHKEEKQHRETVIKHEQKANVKLTQDEHNGNAGEDKDTPQKKKSSKLIEKEKHPYKGNVIDYSG